MIFLRLEGGGLAVCPIKFWHSDFKFLAGSKLFYSQPVLDASTASRSSRGVARDNEIGADAGSYHSGSRRLRRDRITLRNVLEGDFLERLGSLA